jgi:hypothetical protein
MATRHLYSLKYGNSSVTTCQRDPFTGVDCGIGTAID